MRLRALLLALLALPLSGCFGGGPPERLAQPTDTNVIPPTPVPTTPTRTRPPPDFTDPGYVTNATWHLGDGWDYADPVGYYHTVRVVDAQLHGDAIWWETRETEGAPGADPRATYTRWINASSWTVVNNTDQRGVVTTYVPGAPERFLRNGSYAYNATSPGSKLGVLANVFYSGRADYSLPWGENVSVGRTAQYITLTRSPGGNTFNLVVHQFSGDYGNDVSYQLDPNAYAYSLIAVRYNGRGHGQLMLG